jgi:hypothetical protein
MEWVKVGRFIADRVVDSTTGHFLDCPCRKRGGRTQVSPRGKGGNLKENEWLDDGRKFFEKIGKEVRSGNAFEE